MTSQEREYQELRRKYDQAKRDLASLKGEEKAMMNTLKTEYGIDTIEDAQAEVEKIVLKIEETERQLEETIKQLKIILEN